MTDDAIVLTIDGRPVHGRRGQTVLEAADEAGVWIPRLCWMRELTPAGACRLCTVRANGRIQAACTQPITPGMTVESDTAELNGMRRQVLEMLFVEGNHFCSVCEAAGSCELQALARSLEVDAPRYPFRFPVRKLDATHPDVFLDRNRCVLCRRCVRASDELDGKRVFAVVGRGETRRIDVAGVGGLGATDATVEDRAIRACPTGAIVVAREAYAVPIGCRLFEIEPIEAAARRSGRGRGTP